MTDLNLEAFLGAFLPPLLFFVLTSCQVQSGLEQTWLENHVHAVKDLKPDNTDFSDFAALKKAIGNRQIVLLGEQTHGDGTSFKAKVRLVKFLHEEMGFNTMAFENGFYQGHKLWSELRKGGDYEPLVTLGMHARWAKVTEIQPLFDYVQKRSVTNRPLKMLGMDCLSDGTYANEHMFGDFEAFLKKETEPIIMSKHIQQLRAYFEAKSESPSLLPSKPRQQEILALMDQVIQQLTKGISNEWNSSDFWAQVWENYKVNQINDWSRQDGTYSMSTFFSRRDKMMARNIDWLGQGEEKIIIWASVTHNLKHTDLDLLRSMGWSEDVRFMGTYLSELKGANALFHLSFTGYEGTYRDIYSNTTKQFHTPSPGSIEALLNGHRYDHAYFMLNEQERPDWLTKPFKSSLVFNTEHLADWSKSVDAIFFSRRMEASGNKQ